MTIALLIIIALLLLRIGAIGIQIRGLLVAAVTLIELGNKDAG